MRCHHCQLRAVTAHPPQCNKSSECVDLSLAKPLGKRKKEKESKRIATPAT